MATAGAACCGGGIAAIVVVGMMMMLYWVLFHLDLSPIREKYIEECRDPVSQIEGIDLG